MRKLDNKFSIDGDRIVNTVSGEAIPEDEPLFLLRARDRLAFDAIRHYYLLSVADQCREDHKESLLQTIARFSKWQDDNPGRVKQPGIAGHIKID